MKTAVRRTRSYWIWSAAGILAAVTVYLNGITFWSVWSARSEVPWRDQWSYFADAKAMLEGSGLSRLWYPYWGSRLVITRLLTLADVQFFSGLNTPLIVLSLATQTAHAALLTYVAWRLFVKDAATASSKPIFLIVAAFIFHLSLSALQLENLIWAAQDFYVLVCAASTVAFFLLAAYATSGRRALMAGCVLCALVSTFSSAVGVLVWPVLLIQSWVLRVGARVSTLFASLGGLIIAAYFWGYQIGPPLGMGVQRAILRPDQSVPVLGMLVATPLSVVSVSGGTVVGCVSLLAALYAILHSFHPRRHPPAMLTVYGAVVVFSLLTLCTMVVNRVSPEFVASRVSAHLLILPSRYFTTPLFFWCALIGISVWMIVQDRRGWPQAAVIGSVTLALTVGTAFWQIGEAANWRSFYRELDVAATALIMNVHDPANRALEAIYPDVSLRSEIRTWLEQRRLSIFHQERAHRIGRPFAASAQAVDMGRCVGAAESVVSVSHDTFRVTGWIQDRTGRSPRDLIFVDRTGIVSGISRSGLRRPDLAGTVNRGSLDEAGWQGYIRPAAPGSVLVYGVLDDSEHYCRVGEFRAFPSPEKP